MAHIEYCLVEELNRRELLFLLKCGLTDLLQLQASAPHITGFFPNKEGGGFTNNSYLIYSQTLIDMEGNGCMGRRNNGPLKMAIFQSPEAMAVSPNAAGGLV